MTDAVGRPTGGPVQLDLLAGVKAMPPPTAFWDWTPARDHGKHGKRIYRHTICRICGALVWAVWTPGHWWVGACDDVWQECIWVRRDGAPQERRAD